MPIIVKSPCPSHGHKTKHLVRCGDLHNSDDESEVDIDVDVEIEVEVESCDVRKVILIRRGEKGKRPAGTRQAGSSTKTG